MPITFDTLDELKAFYRMFKLEEKAGNGSRVPRIDVGEERPRRGRPGRKPGSKPALKRGPKPKKAVAVKATAKKTAKPRAAKGETLTAKIQGTIRKFLDQKKSFTANDVYDDLVKREPTVNKQSVITSVLKQMNSTFKNIAVTERPGMGPRPVKLYNP